MKLYWKQWADRIDDMTLRERVMIFAMAALAAVALIDAVSLGPLQGKQKRLSQQVVQEQGQIKTIQAQFQTLLQSRSEDPNTANRARLESLKKQLAELDVILQGKQDRLVAPEKIAGLLEEILTRNRRLQLVFLRTLPAAPLIEKPDAGAGKPVAAGAAPVSAEKQVFKHGVEITVKGGYLDLLGYLSELEKLPWQMYWGKASLHAEEYPAVVLTLTVYTLSLDKTWLKI